jgi:alpha-L-rhamnosidase
MEQRFHFGDWLFYRPFDDNDGRAAVSDKYMIAQSFFAHSTQLMINTAKVLGKEEDVAIYTDLLEKIKAAYLEEYVTPNGRLISGTQTAYVLALNFDLLPEDMRTQAASRLVENIRSYGNHLTTGFLGTPLSLPCVVAVWLYRCGLRSAFAGILSSWLYPVKMGATTIWERWDGQKPDSTFKHRG